MKKAIIILIILFPLTSSHDLVDEGTIQVQTLLEL
jgi:hypothetical protein